MHAIHWLGDDGCHDAASVGGKAANLSRLAALHTVPPGFALAATSTRTFSVPMTGSSIRDAYTRLAERRDTADLPVAVRSSALDEDGSDASFAGQHDTYLNIRGADAVLDAVHRCVLSSESKEALAYRVQRGLTVDDAAIAVLVQELVMSDVSAVVFSANPITGRRDEIMINANWGLGESIVGGTATPDTFVVAKDHSEVLWSDLACKERMTVLAEHGTVDIDVPADLQMKACLQERQIFEIARLASTLEQTLGYPVDVECAIAQDVLYLLQCRPITTLR